jgi:isoleucyl-tRNA synthetase
MTHKNEQAANAPDNGPDMAGHDKATSGKELSNIAQMEEKVLQFWQDNKTFEKTLEKESPEGEYVFYDGPPFATGTPHYGHILAGIIKDAIPRYQTMKGHHVRRRWGWDCHGLPIENLIQKEHNLKSRQDIEEFGIKKFNQAARESVFRYDEEWRKVVPRTGRWVDMDDQYTTMDSTFTESGMWAFKTLYEKGLVYEGFKSMHISPLLESPLSNFEVNQNYKDITDISVYAKFAVEGEKDTYFIAWTTTPWTLPGNVALAVGPEVEYVTVEHKFGDDENVSKFIVAKSLVEKVFADKEHKIVAEMTGSELIGKKYKPLFDYYASDEKLENSENGWQVYGADFVTTEDGTGIVHIAPAFGEDDLNLGQAENLPFIQHVNIDGTIRAEVTDFAGRQAKPKPTDEEPNKHQETDIEVIKYLAHHGGLFHKEKFTHSYPHCYRTDAPLLNYAMSSWFIRVTDFKDKMAKLNKKVNWVPENVGDKRFGNWLENAKDWGVSRNRYWGTPIPIWRSDDQEEICVLGSLEEIREKTRGTNKYFVMRHGEAEHNIKKFLSADNSEKGMSRLTDKGKNDVQKAAQYFADKKIDMIFVSPLHRTQETAKILAEKIGLKEDQIITDDRLKEVQSGILNGESESKFHEIFDADADRFVVKPEGGENLTDIRRRVGEFIYEINAKYQDKNILIVTHDYPIWMLKALKEGLENKPTLERKAELRTEPGTYTEYDFAPIPHNDDYVLDYHRPFIDDLTFEQNGKKMRRIEDVFDTWFDSGSMPFAINHYPFSTETFDPGDGLFGKGKQKGFPADFIAEGLDQTRGWFYTLLAMNTALFKKSPYQNVVVNGLVLAEDGRKMSKSLKNYPDPMEVFDKYGADAVRYYMLNSPIVRSEPLSFTEKGVDEIVKKISNRLLNVVSFYELYGLKSYTESEVRPDSNNPLDEWMLSRLSEVADKVTTGMNNYELDRASRPILDLIDDLSTWYLRRSRDRFKMGDEAGKNIATKTIAYTLLNISKILAPFMPFLAEEVYQRITGSKYGDGNKSVHLVAWPELAKSDSKIIKEMTEVREIVTNALELRDRKGLKVRQPLQTLFISQSYSKLDEGFIAILREEVNVKEVKFKEELKNIDVDLDTNISDELKQEGISREVIRCVQSIRKQTGLNPEDVITLKVATSSEGKDLIEKFKKDLTQTANIKSIDYVESLSDEESAKSLETDGYNFEFAINN